MLPPRAGGGVSLRQQRAAATGQRRQLRSSAQPQPRNRAQRQPRNVPFWNDVAVCCCSHYKSGTLTGLISWNEDGTKHYFRDCPQPGLRCLFADDQLQAVFVCEKDKGAKGRDKTKVARVHLISGWKITETFKSVEEALRKRRRRGRGRRIR